ncbi:hypothetical protein KL86CLO1_11112 [uncultured Eubacteriales bacterium]|uniref:Uncharacterized protein n=1 Tax=uncultured Eubacteriales bacterium TaxID=172733 RepID=A0A212JHQ9_9FIRM|nr:hypothetical protein KL86CLO1_11112 [uncultured Eubacteriales bacterium]
MSYISVLFGWMPLPLELLCKGVVAIFSLIGAIRIITLIKNMIPFL